MKKISAKRIAVVLLVLLALLTLCACTDSNSDSAQKKQYDKAVNLMKDGKYLEAEKAFRDCDGDKGFENAKDYAKYCAARAKEEAGDDAGAYVDYPAMLEGTDSAERKAKCGQRVYDEAMKQKEAGNYVEAMKLFQSIAKGKYEGAAAQYTECQNLDREQNYKAAEAYLQSGNYDAAIEIYTSLSTVKYEDSSEKLNESIYLKATKLLEEKNYPDAYDTFALIAQKQDQTGTVTPGYKDVDEIIANTPELQKAMRVSLWRKFKNEVPFGKYEQDNNTENGAEYIWWTVLSFDRENYTATLISTKALDVLPFNRDGSSCGWDNSSLRAWLNGDFVKQAFNEGEAACLTTVKLKNEKNPDWNTSSGADTEDRVYLLSVGEIAEIDGSSTIAFDWKCQPTDYCKERLTASYNSYFRTSMTSEEVIGRFYKDGVSWWLRTAGFAASDCADVTTIGNVHTQGRYNSCERGAVRPVIVIDLNNIPVELMDYLEARK